MVTDRTGTVYKCPFCGETDTDVTEIRSHINNSKEGKHSGVSVETMDRPIETVTEEDFEDASSVEGKMSFETPDTDEMLASFVGGSEGDGDDEDDVIENVVEGSAVAPGFVMLDEDSAFWLLTLLIENGESEAAKWLYNSVTSETPLPRNFVREKT